VSKQEGGHRGLVEPLINAFTPLPLRGTLLTMLAFCAGVLLIACVNVNEIRRGGRMIAFLMGLAVTAGLISPGAPQVASRDMSGAWELSVTTSRGVETATLTLKNNGERLSPK
jgi:beta-lactamase regulating signal transducer with metallopeptidase domain